ncbi:unnamed protein product [Rotaria magnacalcarata]|nr:unnamed protein product [Rotaria magnacalcarata]
MSKVLETSDEQNKPAKDPAKDINHLKLENTRLTNELEALKMEMESMRKTIDAFILDMNTQADVKLKLEQEVEDLKKELVDAREHRFTDDDSINPGFQCNK